MSSPLTSHVLDTAQGSPAVSLSVDIHRLVNNAWVTVASGKTNRDGRVPDLLTRDQFKKGTWRATFHTGSWLRNQNLPVFYPEVTVVFVVDSPTEHYHIPLLLSPFGYSTYRGS